MSERADKFRGYVQGWLLPIVALFCWWHPFRFRQISAVLLPDGMAIFTIAITGIHGIWFINYLGWTFVWLYFPMLLASPFVFLVAILIEGQKVKIVRMFGPIPYWIHKVPAHAKFDLYEAWEDPAPSGVGFGIDPYNPIHLGTTVSAMPLFRHVGDILRQSGWRQTAFGWEI